MKKIILLFTAVLFLGLMGSATSGAYPGNPDTWLPKDFDPQKGILLIQEVTWPKRQQRKMEEFMKENYPYKYEFVSDEALADTATQYSDRSVYRFVILNHLTSHTLHQYDMSVPNSGKIPVGMFDFFFIDRQNKKQYPATGMGSSWASVTFRSMMNKILKK